MFTEVLSDITNRLQDVDGVLLMGIDGLPIDKVIKNKDLNVEALTAEFTTILRNTVQTSAEVNAGALDEVVILSDKLILLMKAITEEYFLMLIMPSNSNFGRARFELKKAKYMLEKELV